MSEPDQGAFPLPDFPLEADIEEMVAAVRDSRWADPVALALQGVEIFLQLSHKRWIERPLEVNFEIRGLCRALAHAQPACAPLMNLTNDMIKPLESFYGRGEGQRMREDMRERAENWREALFARERQRIMQAAQLIQDGSHLLLFGYGTDLIDALRQARAAGLEFTAASLSGPTDPPDALAVALGLHGIPVAATRPDEAGILMKEATAILLGAHGLSPSGLVHWRGTSELVQLAEQHQVPRYCVCGPERFFPAGYSVPMPDAYDPAGTWENTPLDLLTGVVTGEGTFSGDALRAALTQRRLESILLG